MKKRTKIGLCISFFNTITLSFILVLLITLYYGLHNYNSGFGYMVCIHLNDFNEFWFEFIMLHILIVFTVVVFFKLLKYTLKG